MSAASLVEQRTLEAERWPTYVLDPAGVVVQVNQAWDREARAAGGPTSNAVLSTRWLDWIRGEEPSQWHAELLAALLSRPCKPGEGDLVQTCECNTPAHFRVFATRFSPLTTHRAREPAGVLVLTTLIDEGPIEARYRVGSPDPARYRDAQGILRQCSGCRRVRVPGAGQPVWEIVPALLVIPQPDVSHGICDLCRRRYYAAIPARARPGS
jgi:hypothetical protein